MMHSMRSEGDKMSSKMAKKRKPALRASVSFPPELYSLLEQIAKEHKVSVAWVIRDAAEKYVAQRWPLLDAH